MFCEAAAMTPHTSSHQSADDQQTVHDLVHGRDGGQQGSHFEDLQASLGVRRIPACEGERDTEYERERETQSMRGRGTTALLYCHQCCMLLLLLILTSQAHPGSCDHLAS